MRSPGANQPWLRRCISGPREDADVKEALERRPLSAFLNQLENAASSPYLLMPTIAPRQRKRFILTGSGNSPAFISRPIY